MPFQLSEFEFRDACWKNTYAFFSHAWPSAGNRARVTVEFAQKTVAHCRLSVLYSRETVEDEQESVEYRRQIVESLQKRM